MSRSNDKELDDVRKFFTKFDIQQFRSPGHLSKRKLQERIDFLQEELNELKAAAETNNLVDQSDALIDLVYVAKGTALMLGIPWEDMWDEVQRANMDKVRGVGKRGNKVDVVKPNDWEPPNHDRLLKAHGYKPKLWVDANGLLREEIAREDREYKCTCVGGRNPACEAQHV